MPRGFIISSGRSKAMPPELTSKLAWNTITIGPFPLVFIIGLMILGLLYFFQMKTATGRSILAVGANQRVARIAGLKVDSVRIKVFIISFNDQGILFPFFII